MPVHDTINVNTVNKRTVRTKQQVRVCNVSR